LSKTLYLLLPQNLVLEAHLRRSFSIIISIIILEHTVEKSHYAVLFFYSYMIFNFTRANECRRYRR